MTDEERLVRIAKAIMTDTLLGCPICGQEPRTRTGNYGSGRKYEIACGDTLHEVITWGLDRREALLRWNNRHDV